MHKVLILACCAVSVSFSYSNVTDHPQKLEIPLNKNRTFLEITVKAESSKNVSKLDGGDGIINVSNDSEVIVKKNELEHTNSSLERHHNSKDKTQKKSLPLLHKIHARITRSKDAVWATITLTFICVLLVLSVAQSRMWKDHYYREAQGVPLPNFNERVLFKDVMEHKISSFKKFFKKKKSKEKNVTELESLLPPSEWEN